MKPSSIFPIGNEGNQIEIDDIGKGEYRLICRDHFSQNFVDYYVTEKELKGLAEFINKYFQNNDWNYVKPVVGVDKNGYPIVIDSWRKNNENFSNN